MAKLEITLSKERKDKLEELAGDRKISEVVGDMIDQRYRFEIERRQHKAPSPRIKRARLN